jgi:hypothetical protein
MSAVDAENSDLRERPAPPSTPRYSALILQFVFGMVGGALLISAALVVMDPYETGRLGLLPSVHWGANTAKTSRAADLTFDSAIVGNSRIMLVRPALLDERTGLKFVSLAIPGSQPREHFMVLDYLLEHHPNPRALVIGFDETWCFDPLPRNKTFEDWAYQGDALRYLAHLYSLTTVDKIKQLAVALLVGRDWRADGLMDYEPAFHAAGADGPEVVGPKLVQPRPTVPFTSTKDFPAATEFREILGRMPPATVVILAWEPVYITMMPEPGSAAERALNACRAFYEQVVKRRPSTAVVNWFVDRPENRDEGNFLDRVHYRHAIATAFGEDIAAAMNRLLVQNRAAVHGE